MTVHGQKDSILSRYQLHKISKYQPLLDPFLLLYSATVWLMPSLFTISVYLHRFSNPTLNDRPALNKCVWQLRIIVILYLLFQLYIQIFCISTCSSCSQLFLQGFILLCLQNWFLILAALGSQGFVLSVLQNSVYIASQMIFKA